MSELIYTGLDELKMRMTDAANIYLDTAEKHLNRTGNKLKKIVKQNTPNSPYEHKHKLAKSWKSEIKGLNADELEYQLRNTAPHYHWSNAAMFSRRRAARRSVSFKVSTSSRRASRNSKLRTSRVRNSIN